MIYSAFIAGLAIGVVLGQWALNSYKHVLIYCARGGTCEKLPDGNFYRIIPEGRANRLEALALRSHDAAS